MSTLKAHSQRSSPRPSRGKFIPQRSAQPSKARSRREGALTMRVQAGMPTKGLTHLYKARQHQGKTPMGRTRREPCSLCGLTTEVH
eukprot:350296-Chlamydomonas_euryale.AAC.1